MHRDDYSRTPEGKIAELTIIKGYAFFWGQWPSNWEPSPFDIAGQRYSCVEQWMMAEKARIFGDTRTYQSILETRMPAEMKRLGRGVRRFDESTWARVREDTVLYGTVEKYRQNDELRQLLLATGDLLFVEASPYDRVWGIGMRSTDADILDTSKWGMNLLGKIVTKARAILRENP